MMFTKLSLLTLALPVFGAVEKSIKGLPYGWQESTWAPSESTKIQLQVALQYQNLDQLEAQLKSVSDPKSSTYGKYLGLDEVSTLFAPSAKSEEQVKSWLQEGGVTDINSDGTLVTFTTTVGKANALLSTEFKVYTDGQTEKLRTTGYSIPEHLGDAVDFVSPTTYFGGLKAHAAVPRSRNAVGGAASVEKRQLQPSCEMVVPYTNAANVTRNYTLIGPECLKEWYNIGDYQADPSSGSTIAFGNFLNESASYSDLAVFEQIYDIPSQNFTVLALINGGVDDQDPDTEMDGEANLDVQNIIGLVDGLPVYAYITGGLPPFVPDLLTPNASTEQNEPYLQYYTYLLSQPDSALPYVITNSYGDHENTVPEDYAVRVCNMIGMLGLRGRTVFESSGDEGVGAVCLNNEPPNQPQFTPQFPGTCPYITAVGGTQAANDSEAWPASSGGFSFYFPTAWYQQDAVANYLDNYINPVAYQYYSSNNFTNFSGRAFPDVAAHSVTPDYLTVIAGVSTPNGGTSAASPVVAAIFALLNDARFRAGLPAIGFANPWLYGLGQKGFNDITEGGSLGCGGIDLQTNEPIPGAGIIPYASWNSTIGWDPATGLGTPNFQELLSLALDCGGW